MRIGAFMFSYRIQASNPFGPVPVFFGQVGNRIGGLVNVNLALIL